MLFICRIYLKIAICSSRVASIALGIISSAMTAIGNDYGHDSVFSIEIEAISDLIDVNIAFAISGDGSNI